MTAVLEIPVQNIIPGENDRTVFNPVGLAELADSIRQHGLAQPITVRPLGEKYQIVAGERRFRAIHQVLAWPTAPCIVREMNDEEASAIMLAENIGRRDLDPVDEALAYQKRVQQFAWSPAEIARRCGVAPERVKKRLKLISLRPDLLHLVRTGNLPVGHAEVLSVLDHNRQLIAARPLIDGQGITLRQFKAVVDQLYAQQCQENLFDLALFGGALPGAQPTVTTRAVAFPVAADLPPVTIPEEHHTGAIIYQYIQDLQQQGFSREAETLGTLLYWLDKTNFARLPVKADLNSPA